MTKKDKHQGNKSASSKRLVVFSGVTHHATASGFVAHRGFVREIDIWARIFERVMVVTRLGSDSILSDEVPYAEKNISVICLPAPLQTDGFFGKLKLVSYTPIWVWLAARQLSRKDIIMARGPDSMGFLGWLVSRFTKLPRFAKYADQWDAFAGEPFGYRIQKFCYRAENFGGPVMIYGTAVKRHPHLVPFFTTGISDHEWKQAGELIEQRITPPPYHLLFVGRFVYFKGVDILLDAISILNKERNDLILHLVGDGPEKGKILEKIDKENIINVCLHGWLGPEELALQYTQAHIFIHPSRKEGFGKVLLEAMSYGLPIIGANVGVSHELVEKNLCGLLFENGNAQHLADQIKLLLSPDIHRDDFATNGRRFSRTLVLENLQERYHQFVQERLLPLE